MLAVFSLLSGVDVSYKTIERLYSDPEVEMAVHNLHVLLLKKKGVKDVDASGDGTGYSLTIKKHYATETQKRKNKAKENGQGKKVEKTARGKRKRRRPSPIPSGYWTWRPRCTSATALTRGARKRPSTRH